MGKKSEYHEQLKREKYNKFKELENVLPKYVHFYLDEMVIDYQINTIIAYTRDLITFFEYLQENNPLLKEKPISNIPVDALNKLTAQDITEYKSYLASNSGTHIHSNQASSIERKMAPLRGFFLDIYNKKMINNNPTINQSSHRRKRKKNREIIYLENDEVKKLLYTIQTSRVASDRQHKFCVKSQLRDTAILTLLLNTGIRVSECVCIDLSDLDLKNNSVKIVRKGGNEATIFFNDNTRIALYNYINYERKKYLPNGDEKALFLSSQKKRMAIRSIQVMIKKYAIESIPNKNISPHKMRSSYGTALYDQTGDIRLVADVLGHADVTTTARHYASMKEKHLQQAGKLDPYSLNQ